MSSCFYFKTFEVMAKEQRQTIRISEFVSERDKRVKILVNSNISEVTDYSRQNVSFSVGVLCLPLQVQ